MVVRIYIFSVLRDNWTFMHIGFANEGLFKGMFDMLKE